MSAFLNLICIILALHRPLRRTPTCHISGALPGTYLWGLCGYVNMGGEPSPLPAIPPK